ncbi:hypothetical protein IAT40_006762 [Kwoniella sp. CBS 6097]
MASTTVAFTPAGRNITPSRPDLLGNPAPPPNPKPLGIVFFGEQADPGYPYRSPEVVPRDLETIVAKVVGIAVNIVASKSGLPIAASIISGSANPDPKFAAAIRHVLHRDEFVIIVDKNMSKAKHALHVRPAIGYEYECQMERAIYMNAWHLSLLLKGAKYQARSGHNEDYCRHLFLSSMTVAHEIIHFLRRQVHIMLLPFGLSVPYQSPHRADIVGEATEEGEGGWQFEIELLGGELGALWFYEPSSPGSSENEAKKASAERNYDVLFPPTLRVVHKNECFDFVVIEKMVQGKKERYEVELEWLREFSSAAEQSRLDEISYPPTIDPKCLEPQELSPTCRRRRGEIHYYALKVDRG